MAGGLSAAHPDWTLHVAKLCVIRRHHAILCVPEEAEAAKHVAACIHLPIHSREGVRGAFPGKLVVRKPLCFAEFAVSPGVDDGEQRYEEGDARGRHGGSRWRG